MANVAHVLGLTALLGAIGIFDLRVLGWARRLPIDDLLRALRPIALGGFGVLAASGAVLFAADAPALATSWLFRAKLALVVLAAANAAAFELLKTRRLPTAVFAATSLGLWLAVAVAGRMIAYV